MFQKLVSFTKKVADLPDQPTLDPASLKAQFDAAPDEVRTYFNNLIDALKLTTSGDSGAKNIGATTVSGLTGNDVQTLLESLNTTKASTAQPPYTNVSLTGSWVGDQGRVPRYYKDTLGKVYFDGSITGGSTSDGTVLWTFPTGFRPQRDIPFLAHGYETDISKFRQCEIIVKTTGDVVMNQGLYIAYLHFGMRSFPTW